MDDFFLATNLSKIIQQVEPLLELVVVVALVVLLSEALFGLSIKGVVDGAEDLMQKARKGDAGGNPWPAVALLLGGLLAVMWLVRGL